MKSPQDKPDILLSEKYDDGPLTPYLAIVFRLAFPLHEHHALVAQVAARSEDEALALLGAQLEDGMIPVAIFSLGELRELADRLAEDLSEAIRRRVS